MMGAGWVRGGMGWVQGGGQRGYGETGQVRDDRAGTGQDGVRVVEGKGGDGRGGDRAGQGRHKVGTGVWVGQGKKR